MALRSWLFVPGDSERKLAKAPETGADAVILDLEDAVAPAAKPAARALAREWLSAPGGAAARWVRVNAVDTGLWRDDLATVLPGGPDGIMLPKAAGPAQVAEVCAEIAALEARFGLTPGSTRILPLVSETPAAALGIAAYATATLPRLAGLTWGAEDLSAELGARRRQAPDGRWTDTFALIRAQVLLAAHAAGVLPIDTLRADFSDDGGLAGYAADAAADGFAGMLAIHPRQVPIINAAFTPTPAQLAESRAIVAAFDASPDAGALAVDGRMVDRPHLRLARRMLGLA